MTAGHSWTYTQLKLRSKDCQSGGISPANRESAGGAGPARQGGGATGRIGRGEGSATLQADEISGWGGVGGWVFLALET